MASCTSHTHTEECEEEIDSSKIHISTDSLLILADHIKENYSKNKSKQRVNMDSLENLLSTEVNLYDASQQEYQQVQSQYQEQLSINEDLMKPTTRKVYKDTVIYKTTYIDTTIYRRDTLTIVDTIWKSIKWRRNKD